MSMFDNIAFDEFTLLEGEQAEEYKARKAKEKEEEEKKNNSSKNRRLADHPYSYDYGKNSENKSHYQNAKEKEFEDSHKSKDIVGKIKTAKERKDFNKNLEEDMNKKRSEQVRRNGDAHSMIQRYEDNDKKDLNKVDRDYAIDAAKRHQRRHAKQESALTLIEAYEPEFIY